VGIGLADPPFAVAQPPRTPFGKLKPEWEGVM